MSSAVTSTDTFLKGLWKENPVFVQVLGMCPVLAVTNSVVNALVMGLATFSFVFASFHYYGSSLSGRPRQRLRPARR